MDEKHLEETMAHEGAFSEVEGNVAARKWPVFNNGVCPGHFPDNNNLNCIFCGDAIKLIYVPHIIPEQSTVFHGIAYYDELCYHCGIPECYGNCL